MSAYRSCMERCTYIAAGLVYVTALLALVSRFVFTLIKRGSTAAMWKIRFMTALGSISALAAVHPFFVCTAAAERVAAQALTAGRTG